MLMLPPAVRVFFAREPMDMRRSFDGLAAAVRELIGEDPFSGHLFVFRNRRGDRLKLLYWDRSGFCIWYKRLEQGYFRFPETSSAEVDAATLGLILEGIDLRGAHRQRRYRRWAEAA